MIYIQLIFIVLILVLLFLDWKKGKGNTIACLGLLVALCSTPYFTISTDLRRHHQEIIWNEKYSVFREQLYDTNSLHLYFQSLIGRIDSSYRSEETRKDTLNSIVKVSEQINEINLNLPYYRLILGKKYETTLSIYIKELNTLVRKLKEDIVNQSPINVQQIRATDIKAFDKYYSIIEQTYTKDFKYGK